MRSRSLLVSVLAVSVAATFSPAIAAACGACFTVPGPGGSSSPQIVTGHRMVMAIHEREAILWDQFRYAGDPAEFSWVLPVSGEVRLEIASDAFFDELERTTTPTVRSPRVTFMCPRFGGGGPMTGTWGGGCGCGGSNAPSASDASAGGGDGGTMEQRERVQIVSQQVVGPYATVVVRSTDPDALATWLRTNGYSIPRESEPIIQYYTSRNMDFLALRLRPGVGVQSMQPVRVRYSGSHAVLPLRMVGIGVGDTVAITLWVFGNGRHESANFANTEMQASSLVWDFDRQSSNYNEAFASTQSRTSAGRSWITEFADRYETAYLERTSGGGDAGVVGPDGGAPPTSELDWGLATNGWSRLIWITRLRTNLAIRHLDADLMLRTTASFAVSLEFTAQRYRGSPPAAPCIGGWTSVNGTPVGSVTPRRRNVTAPTALALAIGLPLFVTWRRRRRSRNG